MLKSITATSITAVVAVALLAGLTVVLTAVVVLGGTAMASQPSAKGDRLPILTQRPACALQSWPYYSQSCQFDLRASSNTPTTVRLIALR
jgi:hypothetical protein